VTQKFAGRTVLTGRKDIFCVTQKMIVRPR